jgi:hypothetical protein
LGHVLRQIRRKKNGKMHSYWSVVENQRLDGDRVEQRPLLYLGAIDSSQAAVWRNASELLDEDEGRPKNTGVVSRRPLHRGRVHHLAGLRWRSPG